MKVRQKESERRKRRTGDIEKRDLKVASLHVMSSGSKRGISHHRLSHTETNYKRVIKEIYTIST